ALTNGSAHVFVRPVPQEGRAPVPPIMIAGYSMSTHRYRSHTCAELRQKDVGKTVRLSGWVHRVRDHGGLLFIDLRDHYGLTQIVADPDSPCFKLADTIRGEWVMRVDGEVKARSPETVNRNLPTGEIEIFAG